MSRRIWTGDAVAVEWHGADLLQVDHCMTRRRLNCCIGVVLLYSFVELLDMCKLLSKHLSILLSEQNRKVLTLFGL